MLKKISLALFLTLISYSLTEKVYDGYKVYDITVKSKEELQMLKNLDTDERELDFLSLHDNIDDAVRLLVKPTEQKYIEDLFKEKKFNYKIVSDNIQK